MSNDRQQLFSTWQPWFKAICCKRVKPARSRLNCEEIFAKKLNCEGKFIEELEMADKELVSNTEHTKENATLDSQPLSPKEVVKDLHVGKNEVSILETPSHQVSKISIEKDIEQNVIVVCKDNKKKGDENDMEVETHQEAKEIQVEQTTSGCIEKMDIQQSVIEIDDDISECNKDKSVENDYMEVDITEGKKEIETEKPLTENGIMEQVSIGDENDNKDYVIELDDDLAESNKVRSDESDVAVTAGKSATGIPIIEIDDSEDDDESKTDTNKDQDEPKIAEADETNTSMEFIKAIDAVLKVKKCNEHLEMEEIAEANETNTSMEVDEWIKGAEAVLETTKSNKNLEMEEINEEPNKTLLKETSARAESPTELDSDDSTEEIYYNQECINYKCPRNHKQFFIAPQFTLSFYKAKIRRRQKQYVCSVCYDTALESYEEYATLLKSHQPLFLTGSKRNQSEDVEIIDSSEEEEEEELTDRQSTDKGSFSKAVLELLEAELENTVKKVLEDVGIQNQLTWSRTLLMARAKKLEEELDKSNEILRSLQQKSDKMHESLNQSFKRETLYFPPLDLNTGTPYFLPDVSETSEQSAFPPSGEVIRQPIQVGQTYFSPKAKTIGSWMPCRVEQIELPHGAQKVTRYKVKFCNSQVTKCVTAKQLAYYDSPLVHLPLGSRVIAYFDEMTGNQCPFYPGIIAEQLKQNNKNRYLIFYDDGYTKYVSHEHVRLVCQVSQNVWEDVDKVSRDLIQNYLTQYSFYRPMIQPPIGQSLKIESNGKWIYARVVAIDCNLVQMKFEGTKNYTEWLYRGSLRIFPIYEETQKAASNKARSAVKKSITRT